MVERRRQVHHLARDDRAVADHRPLDDPVHADDADLGMIDDRRRHDAAERAEARNRDRRTAQLVALRTVRAHGVGEPRDFGGDRPHVARFGMAQHRHRQPAVRLRRDAHVHRAVARDHAGFVVEARIDLREVAQREHHRADQQRQRRELAARIAVTAVQFGAQRFELGHVDFLDVAEVRNAALRFLHLARDRAPQADHRYVGFVVAFVVAARLRRMARPAARTRICIEIRMQDPPRFAGAAHIAQLDAHVPRALAHGRRRERPFTRRERRAWRFRFLRVIGRLRTTRLRRCVLRRRLGGRFRRRVGHRLRRCCRDRCGCYL